MNDLLSAWIGEHQSKLEAHGFKVTLNDPHTGGSRSVDLESPSVVGTISHWPEEQFEFQFNSCVTGDVILLEEKSFSSIGDLDTYFEELRKDNLISN